MADALIARFYNLPVENKAKSTEAGRPIFDDHDVVEIRTPGDNSRTSVQPADYGRMAEQEDGSMRMVTNKERFPQQWAQYKANTAQTVAGTPLSEAPFLTEGQRKSFRAVNVLTVEQLASLEGNQLKSLGQDGREFKNKAQAYLDAAEGTGKVEALQTQMEAQASLIADLQQKLAKFDPDGDGNPGDAVATKAPADRQEPKPDPVPEATAPVSAKKSPFDDPSYTDDDIRTWLADAAPDVKVDGRLGRAKLIELADEVNAKLAEGKKVA